MPIKFDHTDLHEGLRYYLQSARQVSFQEAQCFRSQECASNFTYERAWQYAARLYQEKRVRHYNHDWNRMEKECYVAIMCYTLKKPNVCRSFNAHCRSARPERSSWDTFPYKSLWWFMVRAFEKLPPYSADTLYKGTDLWSPLGGMLPLPQFISASESKFEASKFGRGLILQLNSVPPELVRDIRIYSVYEHYEEVLIWPFCTFTPKSQSSNARNLIFYKAEPPVAVSTSYDEVPVTSLMPANQPGMNPKSRHMLEQVTCPSNSSVLPVTLRTPPGGDRTHPVTDRNSSTVLEPGKPILDPTLNDVARTPAARIPTNSSRPNVGSSTLHSRSGLLEPAGDGISRAWNTTRGFVASYSVSPDANQDAGPASTNLRIYASAVPESSSRVYRAKIVFVCLGIGALVLLVLFLVFRFK